MIYKSAMPLSWDTKMPPLEAAKDWRDFLELVGQRRAKPRVRRGGE